MEEVWLNRVLNHLIATRDLEYCSTELYQSLREQIEEIQKLLNGYIAWLKAKKFGENEPGAKRVVRELPMEYFLEDEV